MNKKVISIVLNNFQNDSRVLKENQSLQKAGYDVQVIALWEEGLKELDVVGGVPVHRVRLVTKNWSNNKLIQLIKYSELIVRVLKQYRKTDIVHCHDLNALPIGVLIKKMSNKRVKIIYDAHEFEINDAPYQSKLSIKLKYLLEKNLICFADKVITVSNSIADEYKRLYSIPKPSLVLNCPKYQEASKQNIFREALNIRKEQKIFLYQGYLANGRGIDILLEAFSSLSHDGNVLVCMGYGPLKNHIIETCEKTPNIFFHEAVSPDVLLNYTSSADYGISFIEDVCLSYRYCLPNKMFEYFMADLPVLTSNLHEMKNLVEKHGLGIVSETNTVSGFCKAIESSLKLDYEQVKENVQNVKRQYCWEEQEKILLDVYGAKV